MTDQSGRPLPLSQDPEALGPACPGSSTPHTTLQMLGTARSGPRGASAPPCRPCLGWASGRAKCGSCCSAGTAGRCRPAYPRPSWWPTCSRRTGAGLWGPEVPPPLWTLPPPFLPHCSHSARHTVSMAPREVLHRQSAPVWRGSWDSGVLGGAGGRCGGRGCTASQNWTSPAAGCLWARPYLPGDLGLKALLTAHSSCPPGA